MRQIVEQTNGAGIRNRGVFGGLVVRCHALARAISAFWGGYRCQENPYARADFDAEVIVIEAGGHTLRLDWPSGLREVR